MDKEDREYTNILRDIDKYRTLTQTRNVRIDVDAFIDICRTTKKYITYCEIIITPEGLICELQRSHTVTLEIETGLSMTEINDMMPLGASPIYWLVNYTRCCAIWYNLSIVPMCVTKKQLEVIERLQKLGIVSHATPPQF